MIEIKNLGKSFNGTQVLKNINITLPKAGLVAILGPSGCGKSTLLNCLAQLQDYEGEISYNGENIARLDDKRKSLFRIKNIGFVFQDFKLFEQETVSRNILLPLDIMSNSSPLMKRRKINDLLEVTGLVDKSNLLISQLSGGEKQRVSIARALVNDPQLILADEPTGSLDYKTADEIMKIIAEISHSSLVVLVTHDEELANKFANQIIEMKDGVIIDHRYPNVNQCHYSYLVCKNEITNKKPHIPSDFLFHHSYMAMKQKKIRTLICSGVTSLGLIGIGLAISLSSTINTSLKDTYQSLAGDSQIMMSVKNKDQSLLGEYAGSYYEAIDISNDCLEETYGVGFCYYADFESFFPDKNEMAIASTTYRSVIEGISARHINDFLWLEDYQGTIYPKQVSELEDDEVVFGLNLDMIEEICFALRIERTVSSLSQYLLDSELMFYFDFANYNWEYSDQQLVKMVGFVLTNNPGIYHSNHYWNEYMFEERMRFPSDDSIAGENKYPWVMKKIPYFYLKNNPESFLSLAYMNSKSDDYIFEISTDKYYPWLKDKNKRILFFSNETKHIPIRYADFVLENERFSSVIFANSGGYYIYPSSLLYGFSKQMYFSANQSLLNETIDAYSIINIAVNETRSPPEGVLSGHYSETLSGGVRFNNINSIDYHGALPHDLSQVVISTNMAESLFGTSDVIGKTIYLGFNNKDHNINGAVYRDFINTQITVCGVYKSSENIIYQNPFWTIGFFQVFLDVSAFDLVVETMAFKLKDEGDTIAAIEYLTKSFPQYEVSNPLSEVGESIDEVCQYVTIALGLFSFISIIIASILLSICNYLHVLDSQKDIALARCLGSDRKDAQKFVYTHCLLMSMMSFVVASFELLIVTMAISGLLSNTLNTPFSISFNPLSLLAMLVLTLVISYISCLLAGYKTRYMNPLESIR